MNHRSRTRTSFTPPAWIAVICVACLALYEQLSEPSPHRTVEFVHRDAPAIVRVSGTSFDFPLLGVRVTPPPGWVHLSTTDPVLAEQPTFASVSGQAAISLRPSWAYTRESSAGDPADTTSAAPLPLSEGRQIQWAAFSPRVHEIVARVGGISIPLGWAGRDDRRLGRWRGGSTELIVIAFGSPAEIDRFCQCISPLAR